MLVGTDPGESGDDCCVRDEGASGDRDSGGACCAGEPDGAALSCKRPPTPDSGGGSPSQRQRCEGQEDGRVFVHCHFTAGDEFEWGETLVGDGPSQFHEELAPLIAAVPVDCAELYVWRGSHWGRKVPSLDLGLAKDVWCSFASSSGFVPKLEQFVAEGDGSVVGKLRAMVDEFESTGVLKWRPLRGATYSWETVRAWRSDRLLTARESRDRATKYVVPSWMDESIDWAAEVPAP
jgi:hypothetical protein